MTIKLLAAYGKYPPNAIITLDATTETALIADKVATSTLTGGVVWVDPNVSNPLPGSGTSTTLGPVAITGTPGAGNLLTATLATGWTATGYQWTRDGVDISGATSATYRQVTADRSKTIRVRATGLAYAGGSVVPPTPSALTLHVTNAVRVPDTLSAGSTQMIGRARMTVRSTTTGNLRIAFPTAYFGSNNGGIESTPGGSTTIGAYVCIGGSNSANAISGGGSLIQVTWGGQALPVIPDGTLAYLSDEISGTANLTPGTVLWVQARYENANGILYESGGSGKEALDSTNGEQIRYAASGLDLTQISLKSAWSGGSTSPNLRFAPTLVVAPTTDAAVLNVGTSISEGFVSSAKGTPSAPAASGEVGDRGILSRAIGRAVAVASVAQGGSRVAQFLTLANRAIRMQMVPYFTDIVTDHGCNDIRGGSATAATVVGYYQSLIALFPGLRVWFSTQTPHVTGAITLADGSDQTPYANQNWPTEMPALNAAIRAGITGAAGYFDLNAATRLGSNELKWYADGSTALLMASDLLHPSTYAEQRVISQGVVDTSVFVR